ncbi:MAG: hypothetical protein C0597_10005 [Marinilabiliales bacterium]|nr:MAG: hypothetical protein C0597_10005 [Marinilabiliales bacterium]
MTKKNLLKYITYMVISITLISSCVTEDNYKYWTFFFDGVPDPTISNDLEGQVTDSSTLVVGVEDTKPTIIKHYPYAENECSSCHDQNNMGAYVEPQPALCYQCHDDMSLTYESLHAPVQAGYCTSCHNPHQSSIPDLLVKEGQELCFECHDRTSIEQGVIHKDIPETDCISCHNRHGGINRDFMEEGTCLKCHAGVKNEFKYVHGPVAAGYCNTCHDNHGVDSDNFLLRTGQELCTYCHDINLVLRNENHEGIGDYSCTECHNPHGGENSNLLN